MKGPTGKQVTEVALVVLSQVVFYFGLRYVLAQMDPSRAKRKAAQKQSSAILDRLGAQATVLTEYEQIILTEVIHPDDIDVTFEQVGGLDLIIGDLKESVIFPLNYPELFTSPSGLLGSPKGILLYGPPGCGKTMLAKALARESGATFINLHMSTLLDKWFGESNRLVNAVFSLAQKLQPAIIFIDEIDSFLRDRKSNDHEVTSMMKAEFMSLWDGLTSGDGPQGNRIVILGATNRPLDIDSAILRRMPKRFLVAPPNAEQRHSILKLILKDIPVDSEFSFNDLVQRTAGYSGSDIKELCRNAAMVPVREHMRTLPLDKDGLRALHEEHKAPIKVRPLKLADFNTEEHPDISRMTMSELFSELPPEEDVE
ncbi:mitochondrial dynamin GTPase Msp1 [Tieghemiomyces parasiticus]|uniref:Mitochondrial dynamin GTPase Msp1 n=1 Tax=Tieghemiomyces parasiticus TaxID=78921 RepID=A0A9W8DJI9_9FUNG|nr:mitochondrial dynamin GTPase Msp1 [Tieghemiomyces parasiticus]